MIDLHPSESAIGSHLDEEFEIAALEKRLAEREDLPGGPVENRLRAEREFHSLLGQPKPRIEETPTANDIRVEEMMHLDM